MKTVILDNGHGVDTQGKRSPVWADGAQLFEWEFNRAIVKGICKELDILNIPYYVLVPEDYDVPLSVRVARANEVYKNNKQAYLVSVHANAGGGTGWEVFTSVGKTKSDEIAEYFGEAAIDCLPKWRMRFDFSDGDVDKESQFYILKNTNCPAILTENGFMDNESDCRYIMSEEGRDTIIKLHVNAIKKYYELL